MAYAFQILIVLKRRGVSLESTRNCWEQSRLLKGDGARLRYPLRLAHGGTHSTAFWGLSVYAYTRKEIVGGWVSARSRKFL